MSSEKIVSFQDLDCWQQARELAKVTYQITAKLPDSEKFGLISQMRRSAVSVASNIAEGFHRRGIKEKIHFYDIAYSSASELHTQLIIACDVEFISTDVLSKLEVQINATQRLVNGLIRSTKNRDV